MNADQKANIARALAQDALAKLEHAARADERAMCATEVAACFAPGDDAATVEAIRAWLAKARAA